MEKEIDDINQEAQAIKDAGAALASVEDKFGRVRVVKYLIDRFDLEEFSL